jgi:hypothetical protein
MCVVLKRRSQRIPLFIFPLPAELPIHSLQLIRASTILFTGVAARYLTVSGLWSLVAAAKMGRRSAGLAWARDLNLSKLWFERLRLWSMGVCIVF